MILQLLLHWPLLLKSYVTGIQSTIQHWFFICLVGINTIKIPIDLLGYEIKYLYFEKIE